MVEPMVERSESTEASTESMLDTADSADDCVETPPKVSPADKSVAVNEIVELPPVEAELIWKENELLLESKATPL
jgi:hypothetical protein